MKAELEKAIEKQMAVNKRTVENDEARKQEGKLSRKDRFALQTVADDEEKLAEHVKVLVKKLGEEQQVWVFSRRLDDARIDEEEVVRLLRRDEPETGELTQRLERGTLRVFLDLKAAFEREMRNPKQPQQAGQQNQGGPQRRRLVPALAELKMLKAMQQDVRRQTADLNEAIKLSGGEPNSMQRELLRRLA